MFRRPDKEELMRHLKGWRLVAGLLIAVSLGFFAGCAEDVGDVDRTQPDKIQKSLFQDNDEWYYRQTVIDTDTQGSMIFEALESPLKRIRWEITEDVLFAYSTVPIADGLQDGFTDPDTRQLGAVAAFPITDHFDVQRDYNPTTGEQSNVLVENRSDNPWFKREYMRVDWSTNLVDGNGMFENYLGTWSASRWDPPQNDRSVHPDRARIGEDYIDVTTQYVFQPDLYACVYNVAIDTQYACEGGRVQSRSSFIRIDDEQQKTYEPFLMRDNEVLSQADSDDTLYTTNIYDADSGFYFDAECTEQTKQYLQDEFGDTDERCRPATFDMFSRFGYFRTERIKYNKKRGVVDQNRNYYANRWNIWQSAYDEDGNRLDMTERQPKPIVYHLNVEYPRDMIPAAKTVEKQWDDAFKEAVMIAKGYDDISQVEQELDGLYGDTRMFKIVQNSCHPEPLMQWRDQHGEMTSNDRRDPMAVFDDFVSEYGSAASADALEETLWGMPKQERVQLCAELEYATEQRENEDARFSWERVGDLRYSFFNWVDEFNGYWSGYGPSAADPLTGQIISGNANFAGTPLRDYSTFGADVVQYINGELDPNDIRYGDHIRDYIRNMQDDQAQQELTPSVPQEARAELANRRGLSVHQNSPTGFTERPDFAEQDDFIKKWGRDRIEQEANRLSETITNAKRTDTRKLEFYDQPSVKRFMMADADFQQMVQGVALEMYGPDPSDDQLHQAYLDVAAPRYAYQRQQRQMRRFAEQNIFASQNLERSLSSLVTYEGVAKAFEGEPRETIRRYIMENAFIGTQLHEIGHTVGLRHNFSASMDALNYHDSYWEIQKAVLEGNLSESDVNSIDDPEMVEQLTGNPDLEYLSEAETRLASIMDYTGDMTGRFSGLGKYDKAAINFAYAEHVQQWKQDVELPNLLWYEEWTRDYTELPQLYANDPNNTDASVKLEGIETILNGREWVPIRQAMTERREGIESNTTNWHNQQLTRNNKPYIDRTVAYNFCSDEFRDSQLGCDVFDWGANQTEVVNHAFNSYRFFQPFWRYRDQNVDDIFFYNSYISRVMRTLGVASRPFRFYSIYQWWDLGAYTEDLERASVDALNFYSELLAMPEPGRYCRFNEQDTAVNLGWYYDLENTFVPSRFMRDDAQCADHIDINRGKGQFFSYDFTDEYYYRIERVGTFVDKSLATQALFDISANYAFSSFFTDARATNISFWTLFEEEMHSLLRGIVIGDYQGFGGVYNPRKQDYEAPEIVDLETLGTGVDGDQQGMTRLYSRVSFNQEFNTLVGGMINASTWYDRSSDFAQYIKVSVTNNESQPYPDSAEVATFTHPVTNQIYHAPQTTDGKSVSVDLVEWANDLKTDWETEKAELDTMEPGDSDYEQQLEDVEGTRRQMEEVIAKLDMIRFTFEALGADALR